MPDIVVAGHICLDIIPTFPPGSGAEVVRPGQLVGMDPAVLSTGGAVSNTGIALHRLGTGVKLLGKVGDDRFGGVVLDLLRGQHPSLAEGMIVSAGEATSYSIILSPPGVDRTFLHCPGANHTYTADDIDAASLRGARLLHFGYPTIMRSMYGDGGQALQQVMGKAKSAGLLTSLDLCWPDEAAQRCDWPAILARVLPGVDLFLPSIEEILLLIDPPAYRDLAARPGGVLGNLSTELLRGVADRLIGWGAAIVLLKLGEHGLYLRTARQTPLDQAWSNVERREACFSVKVVGTTGAGDCTIAGFLAGVMRGLPPEQTMTAAVGVGAFNVEVPDAVSGVPTWEQLQARIAQGWKRLTTKHTENTEK